MKGYESTDVLIVGGGLAGLATAVFLAWHGVDCLMVEKHGGTSIHPRARGINPRTMELMRSVGLEDRLRATESARALAGNAGVLAVESLVGKELGRLQQAYHMDPGADFSALTPTPWCLCHQDEFEVVLRARAEELGAKTAYGTRVSDIQCTDDEVKAVLHGPDQTSQVRARYLVAADGASSPIRTSLGIPFEGVGSLANYANIHFYADLRAELGDRRFVLCYTINPRVRGALLPIDNARRWLLHVPYSPSHNTMSDFDDERCTELVRAAAGCDDLDVKILGVVPWEAAGRTAGTFHAGRCLLVGDAAHVMPPSGAFGSNVGIQDAHSLAWRLAAIIHGWGGEQMLADYDAERRPIAAATVHQAVLRSKDRPRLTQEARPKPNPAIMPDSVVMFGGRYPSPSPGSLVAAAPSPDAASLSETSSSETSLGEVWEHELGGLPGTRAPHLRLPAGGSLLDLYRKTMVLVVGPAGTAWRSVGARAHARLNVPFTCHQVGVGPLSTLGAEWADAHGVGADGAVLVRPDGYVTWRSAGPPGPRAEEELAKTLRTMFRRSPG
ncbi:FAD-dependent monooxygenase [Sinosporangium siamense]|uniref:FAD-dependent oxidoreductase n=1 Tax=Sinosporangium siamense TaxID=1367973 RepID=A0A919V952_9ACTN|nr:FAD-dependent monooxygenase [Sinosporangium siamense]GII95088.1 FAD-dependent oxidoreductase [Sinosporangium siamense]